MSTKRSAKVTEVPTNGRSSKRRKGSEIVAAKADDIKEEKPLVPLPEPVVTISPLQEIIKSEFVCTVCLDLAINAHGLSCSHLFCEYCIKHWLEKNSKCPFCRKELRFDGKPVPISAIDHVLEKYFENQPQGVKDERSKNVEERAKLVSEMQANRPNLAPRIGHGLPFLDNSDYDDYDSEDGSFSSMLHHWEEYDTEGSELAMDSFSSESDSDESESTDGEFGNDDRDDIGEIVSRTGNDDSTDSPVVVGVYRGHASSRRAMQRIIMESMRFFGRRRDVDNRVESGAATSSNRTNGRSTRSRANTGGSNSSASGSGTGPIEDASDNVVELPPLRRSARNQRGAGGRRDGAASRRGFNN